MSKQEYACFNFINFVPQHIIQKQTQVSKQDENIFRNSDEALLIDILIIFVNCLDDDT